MKFTREQVIEMARDAGVPDLWLATISEAGFEALERCASVVADSALEAAAVKCDSVYHQHIGPTYGEVRYGIAACTNGIRAMKEPAQ